MDLGQPGTLKVQIPLSNNMKIAAFLEKYGFAALAGNNSNDLLSQKFVDLIKSHLILMNSDSANPAAIRANFEYIVERHHLYHAHIE